MIRNIVCGKSVVSVGLSFVLTSCMHLGMLGTHGENQSSGHRDESGPVLEKEVWADNVVASAAFPPLILKKETVIELKLKEKDSGRPISGATVSFHASYIHTAEGAGEHNAHGMHDARNSAAARLDTDHSVNFEHEIQEGLLAGIYTVAFTPVQSGDHTLMFHVSAIGNETLDQELVIETTRKVASGDESHGRMRHGMSSTSEYLIIGGALMGAMMIGMWATGVSVF